MATITVSNTGGTRNWADPLTWVGGSVPLATDSVVFTATSGNLIINAASACLSIDCTGFTGTLSGSSQLTVAGSVTLAAGMTLTYTGTMTVNTTAILTSNGKTFSGTLLFAGTAQTFTLADDWTINGGLTFLGGSSSTITINGNNLYANGNITMSITSVLGTTKLIIAGTCTYASSSTGIMRLNVDINTASTVTFTGTFRYGSNTLKYFTASSVTTTGSTLSLSFVPTIDTNGIIWNNISTGLVASTTLTLTSNLTCSGNFTNSSQYSISGANIIVGGSFTNNTGSLILASTGGIILNGTGTLSCNSSSNYIACNLTINTLGTITFGTTVAYRTGILAYIPGTGTVNTTGSTLIIGASTTLDTNGITWNNISLSSLTTYTLTLSSTLSVNNTFTFGSGGGIVTINGSNINLNGSLSNLGTTSVVTGSSTIIFNGTGTWSSSHTSTGNFRLNVTFNTLGIITISGVIYYRTGTITYTDGTVDTTSSTLNLMGGATLDTNGITWNNVNIGFTNSTITLNSNLDCNTLTIGSVNVVFAGIAGFTCMTFSMITNLTAAKTLTLVAGVSYNVTDNLTITGASNTFRYTIKSSIVSSQSILTLSPTATQDLKFVNATDIDSSLGQTIYSSAGTLTNTLNWNIGSGSFFLMF